MAYWLTPDEFKRYMVGRHDVCPYPRPDGYDALTVSWTKPWYCNAPFSDLGRFVDKAIVEGGPGIFVWQDTSHTYTKLARAGARFVDGGDIQWLDTETKKPGGRKHPVWLAVLGGGE